MKLPEGYVIFEDLITPIAYFEAAPDIRALVVNGCGPSGWKNKVIPDNLYGISIKGACNRHDWEYTVGETKEEKDRADSIFLQNMERIIDRKSLTWFMRALRVRAANGYYEAVSHLGDEFFWKNKRRPV